MTDHFYSIEDIKDLMAAMERHHVGTLKLERDGAKLQLECPPVPVMAASPGSQQDNAAVSPAPFSAPHTAEQELPSGKVVTSPIVGTFYSAPSPDSDPYAREGDRVEKGQVLFIIESMKLMNEVNSEFSGTVSQILVENGQGVEFGQPILVIA